MITNRSRPDYELLAQDIKCWGGELGFQQLGITRVQLESDEARLQDWLDQGLHGKMAYMERHGTRRSRPAELLPGTTRIISARMDYLPSEGQGPWATLRRSDVAYISRYATGRDYHNLMRKRLQKLASRIEAVTGPFQYRAFVDSAPVLEKALARNAGLGWIGKHSNLINQKAGSWFFLGEIYTDLPLPVDPVQSGSHCGTCVACLDICPTRAIIAPYRVDARRCISYLTIELKDAIPESLRPLIGNRIFGCDDCQLICPWNRFAKRSAEPDFGIRDGLDAPLLTGLFDWTEAEFRHRTEGSAIRRIGYERWLRNIAVALGNAPTTQAVITSLAGRKDYPSALVAEHVRWALHRHQ